MVVVFWAVVSPDLLLLLPSAVIKLCVFVTIKSFYASGEAVQHLQAKLFCLLMRSDCCNFQCAEDIVFHFLHAPPTLLVYEDCILSSSSSFSNFFCFVFAILLAILFDIFCAFSVFLNPEVHSMCCLFSTKSAACQFGHLGG